MTKKIAWCKKAVVFLVLSSMLITNFYISPTVGAAEQSKECIIASNKGLIFNGFYPCENYNYIIQITSSSRSKVFKTATFNPNKCSSYTLSIEGIPDGQYLLTINFKDDPNSNDFPRLIRIKNGIPSFDWVEQYSQYAQNETKDSKVLHYLTLPFVDGGHIQSSFSPLVKSTVKNIIKNCTTDYQKVKAIHDYVATNMWYDYDTYNRGGIDDNLSADQLLKSKIGQCGNIAYLAEVLLRAAGIPAKVIGGAVGSFTTDQYNPVGVHGWTEAYCNGRWIVMDCTWDCANSYVNGKYSTQMPCSQTYFDQPLQTFAQTHEAMTYTETVVDDNDNYNVKAYQCMENINSNLYSLDLLPYSTVTDTFLGYYKDPSFKTPCGKTKFTTDMVIYPLLVPTYYTWYFDTNGGKIPVTKNSYLIVASETEKYNTLVKLPKTPIKAEYTFNGWFTAKTGGKQISSTYKIPYKLYKKGSAPSLMLYAHWSSTRNYKVTYKNGAKTLFTKSVKSGAKASSITAPAKSGYEFVGWYKNSKLTIAMNFKTTVKANLTLYAKYVKVPSIPK